MEEEGEVNDSLGWAAGNGLGGSSKRGRGRWQGPSGQKTTAVLRLGSHCHPTGTPTASEKTFLSKSVIHLL